MRYQNNLILLALLSRVRFCALTTADVANHNSKMVTILKLEDSLNNIIIVERNKMRYLIN